MKGTNFEETEEALGKSAAVIQRINREVFIFMTGFASVIGAAVLVCTIVYFGAVQGASGFADSMYHTKINEAVAELGKSRDSQEVFALAYSKAHKAGFALMLALSAAIVFAGLVPTIKTAGAEIGLGWLSVFCVFAEVFLSVAGFYYRTFTGTVHIQAMFVTIVVGVAYSAAPPIISHGIVRHIRKLYKNEIDANIGYFTELIKRDFLKLLK